MRSRIALALLLVCAAALHAQARGLLQAAGGKDPDLPSWFPWKDEAGVWHAGSNVTVDFSKLTFSDLPKPETFLATALTSPYAIPVLPLDKILVNTIKTIDAKDFSQSIDDWIKLLNNAGDFVTSSLPGLMQTSLNKLLTGVTFNGKSLVQLPALANVSISADKTLAALPQLLGITATGIKLPKLLAAGPNGSLALGLAGGNLTLPKEVQDGLASSLESLNELKQIPALFATLQKNLTMDELKKMPAVLNQVASITRNVAENVAHGIGATIKIPMLRMPSLEDVVEGDLPDLSGLQAMLGSRVKVELPAASSMDMLLANVSKALPEMLGKVGDSIQINNKPLPKVSLGGLKEAWEAASSQDLLVNKQGSARLDLAATMEQLPGKVPVLGQMVKDIFPSSQTGAVDASLDKLQDRLQQLSSAASSVLRPAKAAPPAEAATGIAAEPVAAANQRLAQAPAAEAGVQTGSVAESLMQAKAQSTKSDQAKADDVAAWAKLKADMEQQGHTRKAEPLRAASWA